VSRLCGDADPRVLDRDHDLVALERGGERDAPTARGVLGAVGQEVAKHLREPGEIDVQDDRLGRQRDDQLMRGRGDQRACHLGRLGDHFGQRHALRVQVQLVAVQPGDVEQVVDRGYLRGRALPGSRRTQGSARGDRSRGTAGRVINQYFVSACRSRRFAAFVRAKMSQSRDYWGPSMAK